MRKSDNTSHNSFNDWETVSFTVNGFEYQALAAGEKGQPLIIALHGWLDNAASFIPMMKLLKGYRFVAVDLPGHGYSAHWPSIANPGYPYQYSELVFWLQQLIDAIEQDNQTQAAMRPILMGHSLGGTLATMYAGALPDELSMLALIESLGPFSQSDDQLPSQLRKAIKYANKKAQNQPSLRVFKTTEEAIERRMDERNAGGAISRSAAELLVERGLKAVEGGYQWRSDPLLLAPSPHRFTEAQIIATIKAISIPVLIIEGEQGLFGYFKESEQRRAAFHQADIQKLPGRHHLHMEHPEQCVKALKDFLQHASVRLSLHRMT